MVILGMFKGKSASPSWDVACLEVCRLDIMPGDGGKGDKCVEIWAGMNVLATDPREMKDMVYLKNYVPDLYDLLCKVSLRRFELNKPLVLNFICVDAGEEPETQMDVA